MATSAESTTPPSLPPFKREIAYNQDTRDYTMILDGEYIGDARTYHDAEVTLDALVSEILALHAAAPAHPLPPVAVVVEVLDDLVALPLADASHIVQARAQLVAGVPLVADLSSLWIDGVQVQPAPSREGWPWRCTCEEVRCWHAALADAIEAARERCADVRDVVVLVA